MGPKTTKKPQTTAPKTAAQILGHAPQVSEFGYEDTVLLEFEAQADWNAKGVTPDMISALLRTAIRLDSKWLELQELAGMYVANVQLVATRVRINPRDVATYLGSQAHARMIELSAGFEAEERAFLDFFEALARRTYSAARGAHFTGKVKA